MTGNGPSGRGTPRPAAAFATTELFSPRLRRDSGFAHHRACGIESETRAFLGRTILQPPSENLGAYAIGVPDFLQRTEKTRKIDHTLTRHEPLIIPDLFRRQAGRVTHLHVDDVFFSGRDDVLFGGAGVMPVPGVKLEAHVRPAFLGELQHLVPAPDEFVWKQYAQVQRSEKFQAESHVRARQNVGCGATA